MTIDWGWRRWSIALAAVLGTCVVEFFAQKWNTAGMSASGQIAMLGIAASYFGFDGMSKKATNGKCAPTP